MLARPSQEHLDAAAKFQLALQRQRSGQLPTHSGPAPAAVAPGHPFLGRHSPTVKTEVSPLARFAVGTVKALVATHNAVMLVSCPRQFRADDGR